MEIQKSEWEDLSFSKFIPLKTSNAIELLSLLEGKKRMNQEELAKKFCECQNNEGKKEVSKAILRTPK